MAQKYNEMSPPESQMNFQDSSFWYIMSYPITFPCKVVNVMDSAYGKFPDIEGDLDESNEQ